jgi:hypothetical protein
LYMKYTWLFSNMYVKYIKNFIGIVHFTQTSLGT